MPQTSVWEHEPRFKPRQGSVLGHCTTEAIHRSEMPLFLKIVVFIAFAQIITPPLGFEPRNPCGNRFSLRLLQDRRSTRLCHGGFMVCDCESQPTGRPQNSFCEYATVALWFVIVNRSQRGDRRTHSASMPRWLYGL